MDLEKGDDGVKRIVGVYKKPDEEFTLKEFLEIIGSSDTDEAKRSE